jgi:hypothetical protein
VKRVVGSLTTVLLAACVIPIGTAPEGGGAGAAGTGGTGGGGQGGTSASCDTSKAMGSKGDGGTAVAPVVTSCGGRPLPATGSWDAKSISPVAVPSNPPNAFIGTTNAVVVDPFDTSTVWVGTGYQGLFQSTDCGSTWKHVNTGTNGSSIDQSVLWSLIVDPVHQGVIYTIGAYGAEGLWKSTNGGVDWAQLFPATSQFAQLVPYNFVGDVSMDPTNSLHLVVSTHGTCNAPYTNGCLAESFDGGATWPNIVSMPIVWPDDDGVRVVNATTWIWGGSEVFFVTTDNGHTWKAETGATVYGNGEGCTQPLERAKDGAYYVGIDGVLRSTDGINWSLAWGMNQCQTPSQAPAVEGFTVSTTMIYGASGNSFYSAPLSDYANWSPMPGPAALTSAALADYLAYDSAHHLLYASCWTEGLFRIVTP